MIPRGTKLVNQEVIHNPETGVTTIVAYHKGQRMEILIDTTDWPIVEPYSWHISKAKQTFYARSFTGGWGVKRMRTRMHALLFPDAVQVDHINHNGLDNRRANLRPATNQENARNRNKSKKHVTCQFIGVSWESARSIWACGFKINGKRKSLGRFLDPIQAARVRDCAVLEHHGEFASLNFPKEDYEQTESGKWILKDTQEKKE